MTTKEEILTKNKYIVLQDVQHEINQLKTQYLCYNNINLKIDIENLQKNSCQKFLLLSKTKESDPGIKDILNDISFTIEQEYKDLYQELNSDLLISSSRSAIKSIIKIISNPNEEEEFEEEEEDDEYYGRFMTANSFCGSESEEEENDEKIDDEKLQKIQMKINTVLDSYPEKLLFNKDKLKNITKTKTKLSEILLSLGSIKKDLDIQYKSIENPYSYVLYSKEEKGYSYVKSLSNILTGNCFFVSLVGQQSCVRNILTLLTKNDNIKKHEVDDLITTYGPLDIMSFSKNIPDSFDKLKPFNIDIPNIYFFEISLEDDLNPRLVEWCKFISFISHATIFCSEKDPTQKELQNLNELSFVPTKTNTLIDCSPGDEILKPFQMNFNIKSLDENIFRNKILDILIQNVNQFIPHETAEKYSTFINESEFFDNTDSRKKFDYDKINDYGLQMLNKSREYFNEMSDKIFKQFLSISNENQYVEDFNFKTETVVDKILQFFYVNMNQTYWDSSYIVEISKVIVSEIENKWFPISKIELTGQLIVSIIKSPKSFSEKSKEILGKLNKVSESNDQFKEPKKSNEINTLKENLDKKYKSLIRSTLGESNNFEDLMDSITNQLHSFLLDNPTASNEEYSKFFADLYKKTPDLKKGSMKKKLFHFASSIRKVNYDYITHSYKVEVDVQSFEQSGTKIDQTKMELELAPASTCHELYELVKTKFNLNDIPFYIIKDDNKYSRNVEVFDNHFPISKLNANSFKVYFLTKLVKSTGSFLESMIVQKEIKIADDFIIRTSSKEAQFNVTYPKNHKGWFNVPFDITTPNPEKSFGEDNGVLIYLKLSADEMNELKEGNAVVHQSYQGDKWVTENDSVFLTYPKCNKAIILVRHCSTHQIVKVNTSIDNLVPEAKKDSNHSKNWEHENGNIAYKRGGRSYYLPVGYEAEGIKVDNFKEYTCVAFHGTKARHAPLIIGDRFKLPSELGGVQKYRIGLGYSLYGKENWANAIFVSPSIKYSALYSDDPIVVKTQKHTCVESGHVIHDLIRIIILQVRVNPSAVEVFPNTTKFDIISDHYTNQQLEWRLEDPRSLFPYRLLTRDISLETYKSDYRKRD